VIQGQRTAQDKVLWLGLNDGVGRLANGKFQIERLPESLPGPVWAIAVDGERVAAQTSAGVAIRKGNGRWLPVDWCEKYDLTVPFVTLFWTETYHGVFTGLTWDQDSLYVGAGPHLLKINNNNQNCTSLCRLDDPAKSLVVLGLGRVGIWAVEAEVQRGLPRTTPSAEQASTAWTINARIGMCNYDGGWEVKQILPWGHTFFAGAIQNDYWIAAMHETEAFSNPLGSVGCHQWYNYFDTNGNSFPEPFLPAIHLWDRCPLPGACVAYGCLSIVDKAALWLSDKAIWYSRFYQRVSRAPVAVPR